MRTTHISHPVWRHLGREFHSGIFRPLLYNTGAGTVGVLYTSLAPQEEKATLVMTALSVYAILKRIGEIEQSFPTVQQLCIEEKYFAYQKLSKELCESIVPSCQRYKAKAASNVKDAVTDQQRYGPETKKKIDGMFQKIDEVFNIVLERVKEVSTIYLAEAEERDKRKLLEQQNLVDSYREKAVSVTSLNAGEAFQLVRDAPTHLFGLIAAEAEEFRQHHEEADRLRNLREGMKTELEGIVTEMNNKEFSDLGDILRKVDATIAFSGSNKAKTLLLTVSKVLSDIHRNPDNTKLRRLNFCNSDLWSKVTGYDEGVALFLFVGFNAKLEYNKEKGIVYPSRSEEATLSARTRALLSGVGYDLFLEMHEPDPEASEMTLWQAWFDRLKENEQIIAMHIAANY